MMKKSSNNHAALWLLLVVIAIGYGGYKMVSQGEAQPRPAAKMSVEAPSTGDYERPKSVVAPSSEQMLERMAYTASYNKDTRCPNWVGWALTAAHTSGDCKRQNKFFEDEEVAAPRAAYYDIRESECGYQRGHMCPSADNKWSYKAQKECFLMTNICPQNGDLNQRDWKYLEDACRDWALSEGVVYIVAGPVFTSKEPERVGEHGVAVPDAFFKVVLSVKGKGKAIGFVYPNKQGHSSMDSYVRTVDEVERLTGLDFFYQLDDAIENRIEAQADLGEWN